MARCQAGFWGRYFGLVLAFGLGAFYCAMCKAIENSPFAITPKNPQKPAYSPPFLILFAGTITKRGSFTGSIAYMLSRTLFYLREYFFPSGCGGCGRALFNGEDAYYGLCVECRTFVDTALAGERRCQTCGKPLVCESGDCLSCRDSGTEGYSGCLVKIRALFPYIGKFKAILGAYKFGKSLGVGNFLAERLPPALDEFGPAAEDAVWVPVPPRPGKIKKQGWDQIERLAGLLETAGHGRWPVCRCLKRLQSRSQKGLNREDRGSNLEGRIVRARQPPKTAVLIDDVITTGATLNACAKALIEGGAERVYGVCLFYD